MQRFTKKEVLAKRRKSEVKSSRAEVIAKFSETVQVLQAYLERCEDSAEVARMAEIVPALQKVCVDFERATRPEDE